MEAERRMMMRMMMLIISMMMMARRFMMTMMIMRRRRIPLVLGREKREARSERPYTCSTPSKSTSMPTDAGPCGLVQYVSTRHAV